MNDKIDHRHPQIIGHYLEAGSLAIVPERLRQLAEHEHPQVRARVAENPNTEKDLLLRLAGDSDCDVRCAAASHTGRHMEVLELLMRDENPTVRFVLAEDANCPEEILEALLYDSNPYVCDRANRTIKRLRTAGFGRNMSAAAPGFPARATINPTAPNMPDAPYIPKRSFKKENRRAIG